MGHLIAPTLLIAMHCVLSCDCLGLIPENYNKDEPPATVTKVNVKLDIHELEEVNDLTLSFKVHLLMSILWIDPRIVNKSSDAANDAIAKNVSNDDAFQLNFKDFTPVDSAILDYLWKPDLYFYENREANVKSALSTPLQPLINFNSGWVFWWFEISMRTQCNMQYTQYPTDDQHCFFRMGSTAHSIEEQIYEAVVLPPGDQNKILQYEVSYEDLDENEKVMQGETTKLTFSATGFKIHLNRRMSPFLMNLYIPTATLVLISWISFLIPTEAIPGRMALLVTIFLMLVNISNSAREGAPEAKTLTGLDTWLLASMCFVALALFEYAFLLKIRFAKPQRVDTARQARNNISGHGQRAILDTMDLLPARKRNNFFVTDCDSCPEDDSRDKCQVVDNFAILIFSSAYCIFNVAYWSYYLQKTHVH